MIFFWVFFIFALIAPGRCIYTYEGKVGLDNISGSYSVSWIKSIHNNFLDVVYNGIKLFFCGNKLLKKGTVSYQDSATVNKFNSAIKSCILTIHANCLYMKQQNDFMYVMIKNVLIFPNNFPKFFSQLWVFHIVSCHC